MNVLRQTADAKSPAWCKFAPRRILILLLLCTFLLTAGGCPTAPKPKPTVSTPRPAKMPTYRSLAYAYNRNIMLVDRLWAKASVQIEYMDDKGKRQRERGEDSTLMIEVPNRLALIIGKLGSMLVHAGCDAQRYWLFDLIGKNTAAFGRHARLDSQSMTLPIRIRPTDLPLLLGLLPIPTAEGNPQLPQVDWQNGSFVVQPPGMLARLFIDPRSALPRRIELIDGNGKPVVIAVHSEPKPMDLSGVPSNRRPRISTHVDLTVPRDQWRLVLKLSQMTDARGESYRRKDRAFRKAFDFEHLLRVHKVSPENVIDLDRGRPVAAR